MYKQGQQVLGKGLSPTSRIILGLVSGFFGLVMILIAPEMTKPFAIYFFGAFCLVICLMCITTGGIRNFLGRIIGAIAFCISIWLLYIEFTSGPMVSARRSQPSILNAILFFFAFGLPGAWFAVKGHFKNKEGLSDKNL